MAGGTEKETEANVGGRGTNCDKVGSIRDQSRKDRNRDGYYNESSDNESDSRETRTKAEAVFRKRSEERERDSSDEGRDGTERRSWRKEKGTVGLFKVTQSN